MIGKVERIEDITIDYYNEYQHVGMRCQTSAHTIIHRMTKKASVGL